MSDPSHSADSLQANGGQAQAAMTAGQLLKAARQAAGLHLAILAVNLKVSVRQLEALEADQYRNDHSPVFVRGLASSVCRQLRIDPAPILALLPPTTNYLEPDGLTRQSPASGTAFGNLDTSSSGRQTLAWGAALAMLALIAALVWLPGPSQWAWLDDVTAYLSQSQPSAPERTLTTEPESVLLTPPPLVDAVPAAALPNSSAPMNAPSTGTGAVPVPVPARQSLAPELAAPLSFKATQSSWIEVRTGQDQVLWSGILNPGESHQLAVPQTLKVVVGRADAIAVTYKGQSFDLQPHTKVNVARFEVKP